MSDDQLALFAPVGDDTVREAITTRLGETLFVEAGAGTGKTHALVERIVALVRDEGVPMRHVAAITFTEKAAAELRDRVRRALEQHAPTDDTCRIALDDLDHAAISTLHAFAQALLTELPIEAGLPPRIEVRDEIASGVAFDERWRRFVDQLLEHPEYEETVLVALATGVTLAKLRTLAEKFGDNWDLLDRLDAPPPLPLIAVGPWIDELEATCGLRGECIDADDKMVLRLDECAAYAAKLRAAPDDIERLRLLRAGPSFRVSRTGRKGNWRCDIDTVRARVIHLDDQREAVLGAVANAAVRRLASVIAEFTAADVAERRAAGELEFHDLLVLARALLRDPEHGVRARARLRARYRRLLIDEFQDTDPIQIELAVLLASDDAGAADRAWTDVAIEPGRLFFVGDPKQSIYRFRRADIATFLSARDSLAVESLLLTRNFRTVRPVLDWVNRVFADLITAHPGSQPEYHALEPTRDAAPVGPAMSLLGTQPHDDKPDAATLRVREAADVVGAVRAAINDRWAVHDDGEWRDACLGDICILLPARTSLGFLERALDDAGIPYRAETSSLVYATRQVRDLLSAVRAVDDATDELALVTTLRSSLFGCGDDDLFEYHVEHRGRWDITAPVPDSIAPEHPVAEAMRYLGGLHEERRWLTPSELLERLVRDRGVLEVGALSGRFRDIARRVRFVVDQARAFAESTGGSLRDYLAWATRQGVEGARVVETVLPETDDDAVRILTVHGAKGLEFPIVICSGMTTKAQTARGGNNTLFPPGGGCEIRLGPGVQTDEFELHKPIDEQMGFHEKLRLLYVACTRARDHLVVSVHRKARDLGDDRPTWTHAELLWTASRGTVFDEFTRAPGSVQRGAPPVVAPPPDRAGWDVERAEAFRRGQRRRFVAATTLAQRVGAEYKPDPGLAKESRDLELPPWNKGRYGTAIGRAVHAVLQTVDLATGAGIDDAAAAQSAAEGVLAHAAMIAALARAAVDAPTVRAAAARPHWRETYVAVPLADITVEGYVDLIYRDDDGLLTVVDYKTDAIGSDAELEARLAHYRVQGAAYAHAVAATTGIAVARCVFVFLHPAGPREVVVSGPELDAAIALVGTLAAAEREDPAPIVPMAFAEP